MPPPAATKKVFSQILSETVSEPIQGSKVVVIHPGSLFLRIGLASDTSPHSIPHCIARRVTSKTDKLPADGPWAASHHDDAPDLIYLRVQAVNQAQENLDNRPNTHGSSRELIMPEHIKEYNRRMKPEQLDISSGMFWKNTRDEPEYITGHDAMMVDPHDQYVLRWPISRGVLNVHEGPGGSLVSVTQDLEDIWADAIRRNLRVPFENLKVYRAVLLIPDIYRRQHVREMFDILLNRLGFAAAFVVQESVCATFGAGMGSACVVDVGDQKSAVCCVEDGLSQPSTRICLRFGGCDITRCFHWLLSRSLFLQRECNLSRRLDFMFMQDLKEVSCHLDQDTDGIEEKVIPLRRPNQPLIKCSARMGDERILAPMAVFFPGMFALRIEDFFNKPEKFISDPSDPNDDDYLTQTMSRHEQAARLRRRDTTEAASTNQDLSIIEDTQTMDDDDMMESSELPIRSHVEEEGVNIDITSGLMGIHQAIIASIEKCDSEDSKRRMYGNILVVGGGLMFTGAESWLQHLLLSNLPSQARQVIDTVDVITRPKETDLRLTCWKGGAVMCYLDTAQELWITPSEWKRYGVRVLRERALFVW